MKIVISMAIAFIEAASYKFIIIDFPILIHIHTFQNRMKFIVARINTLLMKGILYLVYRKKAIIVFIHMFEELPQCISFFGRQLSSNKTKKNSF